VTGPGLKPGELDNAADEWDPLADVELDDPVVAKDPLADLELDEPEGSGQSPAGLVANTKGDTRTSSGDEAELAKSEKEEGEIAQAVNNLGDAGIPGVNPSPVTVGPESSSSSRAMVKFNQSDKNSRRVAYERGKLIPDLLKYGTAKALAKKEGYDLTRQDFDQIQARLETEFGNDRFVNEWVSNARLSAIRKKVRFNHQITLEEQHILNNVRSGY